MKKVIVVFFVVFASLVAKAQDDTSGYKYILDYQVPTSPAFTLLDVSPQQVTRGSAAKPLVANIFSNYLNTGKLDPGIALDFSPYLILGGGFKNIDEYQKNTWKRIAANTLISLATLKNSDDPNNLDFAGAGRITLWDSRDLFANSQTNKEIVKDIGTGLAKASVAPVVVGGVPEDSPITSGNPTNTVPVDLSEIYKKAYDRLRNMPGSGLSVGFGYRGTAKGAYLTSDSIINEEFKLWGSFTRYRIFRGADLLSIVQGRFGKQITPEWKAGVALASQNKSSNMGAEVVYNFLSKQLEYGATFEIRLFKQLTYVVSINKRSLEMSSSPIAKLRAISTFRYDIFGH